MSTKKFRIATLGCRTNQYESEAYATQLREMGYEEATADEPAEICIVNTCTVTESADSSSRHQIRQLHRQYPNSQIVVTGCLAERLPEEIKKIEGVTLVVSNQEKENLLNKVFPTEDLPEFKIDQFAAHTRAFVKVQDGCNSFCTYCIIPYVRGRSRSRPLPKILEEVHELVRSGYKEVVLTGINIGDYEGENGEKLTDLVKSVDQIEGLERIRISSIDPDEIDDNLMQAVLEGKKTCHSMHIVLQAGSNLILKRMNRKYTKQIFLETVDKLKKASPQFTVTTDIIVGFPGESEQDFQETLDIMKEVQFAKVHMFPYSPRERTRAALYPGKISPQVMQQRKDIVLREAERLSFAMRQPYVSTYLEVLVEEEEKRFGHSENFLPVYLTTTVPRNTLVKVKCIDNLPEGLLGEVVL
ncbi:tRNA (N(6)-L-threonylcarbamoyladenosine(37)-C(2))-methylthiotransferase MtaB [Rhabdochlamydiaceae symbiont of Dictyostelium giganteum]|uniref:tRNA (N(6)-L-threonylcarbamoyladenosine(37)-C(2))- methylthiotransferase MtaB n=1 Tax=Rhabdochlamydiaceae symbiont of Dictyostelium giganteum TaxID=3342349 RepID=UPI00384BA9B1